MRHGFSLMLIVLLGVSAAAGPKPASPPSASRQAIVWRTDHDRALQQAKRSGEPALLYFHADWCGPCRLMERTTFRSREVARLLGRMVCVRIDLDAQPALAERYHVWAIPRLLVLTSRGRTVVDSQGYQDAGALLETLSSAAAELGGPRVAQEAGGSPGVPAKADAGQLPRIITDLGNPERAVRLQAARQVRSLGAAAVPALLDALDRRVLAIRLGAYEVLLDAAPPPAALHYDPWAPSVERRKAARALRDWWRRESKGKASSGKRAGASP